jgi:hypothetical protein
VKGIKFEGKHCSWTASVGVRRNKRIRIFLYSVNRLREVLYLCQIYKSIFKLNINSNSHIVQDERKQISCESPLAWRRLDAAWMQLCLHVVENLQKYRYILSPVYTTLNFWYGTDKIGTRTTFLVLGLPIQTYSNQILYIYIWKVVLILW